MDMKEYERMVNNYLSSTQDYMDKKDDVNSPTHYNQYGIECIDSIEASMTKEEFIGYLKGNVEKYVWRYRYKGQPLKDLRKAEWYLKRLINVVEKEEK